MRTGFNFNFVLCLVWLGVCTGNQTFDKDEGCNIAEIQQLLDEEDEAANEESLL